MSDNVFLGGNAAILQSIVDGTPYDGPIQSPIEELLLEVKEVIEAGGGGGTTNYNSLTNKPQINGNELKGNLSGNALGLLTISNTIPTATADLEGQQLLYVGATTASYTKGLIYECQEVTPATSPATYTWAAISAVSIEIDSALSTTSENPVQNKIVTAAINNKIVAASTMPSNPKLGQFVIYTGATGPEFTKYGIYEVQEIAPSTYSWQLVGMVNIVDSLLNNSSENPVQNKVINAALNNKLDIASTMQTAAAALVGKQVLYVGATDANYTKGCIYECQEVTPATDPATYHWVAISAVSIEIDAQLSTTSENPVQNKVVTLALGDKLSMVTTMGTPSAELLGARLLYVGATNANFTKGCIYECQEVTPATDPATYTWALINGNSGTVDSALSSTSENPVQNKVIYEDIYEQLYSTIAGIENNDKGAMELYSQNLNNIVTSGFYNAMTCTNAPFNYCMLIVCGYYLAGYCSQIAIDATTGAVRFRNQINGTWGSWDDLTQVDGTTITKNATTKQISAAVATAIAVGVVKPDGESTSVDANGNLSVINRLAFTNSMPTAEADLEGKQLLYVGANTADYSKGAIYECQEVTPATDPATYEWVLISYSAGTLWADNPIGSILPYGGSTAPSGWLLCQGQAISRTTYADLFAVIGTSFGAGDGSTTFNLPDLREAVPKGAGLQGLNSVGAHLDSDGLAVGEFIDDRLQTHQHISTKVASDLHVQSLTSGGYTYGNPITSGNNNGRSGDTTEVKAVGVNYIIKAQIVALPADFSALETRIAALEAAIDKSMQYSD